MSPPWRIVVSLAAASLLMILLTPLAAYAITNGLNNNGQIVGLSGAMSDAFIYRAFVYSGGVMTDLGTLGGDSSYANDINTAGQVVGGSEFDSTGVMHPYLFSGGVMTDLGTLGGEWSEASCPAAQEGCRFFDALAFPPRRA